MERVNAGQDPWKWKSLDPLEEEYQKAKISNEKSKAGKKSGGGGQTILNQDAPNIQRLRRAGGGTASMGPASKTWWRTAKGINYDKETNTYRPSEAMGAVDLLSGEPLDLSNAMSVNFQDYVVRKNPKTGEMEAYMLADVIYDADRPGEKNPHKENLGIFNAYEDKGKYKNGWTFMDEEQANVSGAEDGNVVSGQVLISIESETLDARLMDELNKFKNIRSNQEGHAASATHDMYGQDLNSMAQDIANAKGISFEKALRYVQKRQEENALQ
jgi:hypothetical protein